MKESDIQNAILEYLHAMKIFAWRNNNTPTYDPTRKVFRAMPKHAMKGISDILGIYEGKLLAIEVKCDKPNKTYPSKEQKAFIEQVNSNGGIAFVARSIDDVQEKLSTSNH